MSHSAQACLTSGCAFTMLETRAPKQPVSVFVGEKLGPLAVVLLLAVPVSVGFAVTLGFQLIIQEHLKQPLALN